MSINAELTKQKIRSKIFLKLKTQKEEERIIKSRIITRKLIRTKVFKTAKVLMCYIALKGEVDTQGVIKQAIKSGKVVAVPVCKKDNLAILPCILNDKAGFKRGPYGVVEPALQKRVPLREIDLVLVPGVAFDKKGNRLGRGKGFYDRFLKKINGCTETIGLAFRYQILPALPASSHDVRVKRVIFA
ncbi:MAG: 5-formyltetrahydrofolate cyclo-ligase [Candidatus Omnitrophota bacterium]